jgi:hypothetical protein
MIPGRWNLLNHFGKKVSLVGVSFFDFKIKSPKKIRFSLALEQATFKRFQSRIKRKFPRVRTTE